MTQWPDWSHCFFIFIEVTDTTMGDNPSPLPQMAASISLHPHCSGPHPDSVLPQGLREVPGQTPRRNQPASQHRSLSSESGGGCVCGRKWGGGGEGLNLPVPGLNHLSLHFPLLRLQGSWGSPRKAASDSLPCAPWVPVSASWGFNQWMWI